MGGQGWRERGGGQGGERERERREREEREREKRDSVCVWRNRECVRQRTRTRARMFWRENTQASKQGWGFVRMSKAGLGRLLFWFLCFSRQNTNASPKPPSKTAPAPLASQQPNSQQPTTNSQQPTLLCLHLRRVDEGCGRCVVVLEQNTKHQNQTSTTWVACGELHGLVAATGRS